MCASYADDHDEDPDAHLLRKHRFMAYYGKTLFDAFKGMREIATDDAFTSPKLLWPAMQIYHEKYDELLAAADSLFAKVKGEKDKKKRCEKLMEKVEKILPIAMKELIRSAGQNAIPVGFDDRIRVTSVFEVEFWKRINRIGNKIIELNKENKERKDEVRAIVSDMKNHKLDMFRQVMFTNELIKFVTHDIFKWDRLGVESMLKLRNVSGEYFSSRTVFFLNQIYISATDSHE